MTALHTSDRLRRLPTYIFAEIEDELQTPPREPGRIDLTRSDPDLPPPPTAFEALTAGDRPGLHRYPPYRGDPLLVGAVLGYLADRFGLVLGPDDVQVVAGTKEALVAAFLAFLDPGDVALIPSPAFPTYLAATLLAGATPYPLPLSASHGRLPDLDDVPLAVLRRARVLVLNYPHNPTGALAPPAFLDHAAHFARRHGLVVLYDHAYAELAPAPQPSFLRRAPEETLEFYSFSKTFSMQGFRLGFVVGLPTLMRPFRKLLDHLSAGVFLPVQAAGRAALHFARENPEWIAARARRYQERKRLLADALAEAGLPCPVSPAAPYLWLPVPEEARAFARRLADGAGVLVTPGDAFGEGGAGHVRLAVTTPDAELAEAAHRIRRLTPVPALS